MDLDRQKAVRAGHRGVITKLTRELDEALTGDAASGEKVGRLNVIYEQLQNKMSVLQKIDNEVLALCAVDDIEREIDEAEVITAKILDYRRRIEVFLKPASGPATAVAAVASPSVVPPVLMPAARTRLPKLELQKFRGNLTSWTSFWDSFKSAVHDQRDISKVDKFNYLCSLLEGPASKVVQGLTLSEDNYDTAVALLQDRFGNKQAIISAHIDELSRLPDGSLDRPLTLRSVYDKIMIHTRGLESLGINLDNNGTMLIPLISPKIPNEVRLRMARAHPGEVWKIQDLMEMIKTEVEAREASNLMKGMSVKANSTPKPPPPVSTASSLYAAGQTHRCVYCTGDHYPSDCVTVKDVKDRRAFLLRTGRCFNCLRPQHRAKNCESTKKCRHCHKKHHQSVCDKDMPPAEQVALAPEKGKSGSPTSNMSSISAKTSNSVLLQTARALASDGTSNNRCVNIRILFDTGSQRSYATESLVKRLNLKPIRRERLQLNTFGEPGFKGKSCDLVEINLQKLNGDDRFQLQVLRFPTICSSLPNLVNLDQYPSLLKLDLADPPSKEPQGIDLLIGSDYYWSIVGEEVIRTKGGPTVVRSKLGWLLSGPLAVSNLSNPLMTQLSLCKLLNTPALPDCDGDGLTDVLRSFWEVESIGINEESRSSELCEQLFLTHIKFTNGRYEVGLPWLRDKCEVPDHHSLCLNRLKGLQRRLIKEPDILTEYESMIKDQLSLGIIEPVNGDGPLSRDDCIHYLPHHPVVKQNRSTTKVRIVYDGSASTLDSLSINDCLQIGPNLIPKLFNVMIKFRFHQIALVADIEKAFLMVGIREEDRDMLRFLWLKEPFKLDSETVSYRFTRLVFGLRPSPAVLGSVVEQHVQKYRSEYPQIVDVIDHSLYIDDLVSGGANVSEAFTLYKVAKHIMQRGGFNLRKWNSNSVRLLRLIGQSEPSITSCPLGNDEDNSPESPVSSMHKLLGINWDNLKDEFAFDFSELLHLVSKLPKTKRLLLKLTASLFDPLGLLSPLVITLKLMFQDLCTSRVNWDEPLPDLLKGRLETNMKDLERITELKVPRCCILIDSYPVSVCLHGFSDASERAYAAVLYISSTYSDGSTEVKLLCSKTRVSPTKKQTIPRLELLGALILARLVHSVRASLPVLSGVYLWTDSMTVLHWICNRRGWKQYVQHRVEEIRKLTNPLSWNHCPGIQNPADLPSRGLSSDELLKSTLWWNGPSFIAHSVINITKPNDVCVEEAEVELMKNPVTLTQVLVSQDQSQEQPIPCLNNIIDCTRYSDIDRLLRVTAYVFRFVKRLRGAVDQSNCESTLSASEMTEAETIWIRSIQHLSFDREYYYALKPSGSRPLLYDQFGLFVDEGRVLRCRGRIGNSQVTLSAKQPALLPSNHHFVKLLVRKAHETMKHCGVNQTLTFIRERFWILKGRQTTRKVIKSCVICRRLEGHSYGTVPSPDLPAERVSEDPPFSHVGVDFAGPLHIKVACDQAEERQEKVYVCLFTCTATRAVHLELTRDIGVDTFLLALRRFVGRRGLPATIISDNAKTFKSSSKQVTKIMRSSEVQSFLTSKRISWKFIIERAPWWGGFYERLIQSVKRCLRKSLGRTILNFDQMNTLLVEIEGILNSRPLTYVEDDTGGVGYTLSPSHLIYGRRITGNPNSSHFEVVSTNETLTKRDRAHKHLLQQFTTQWRKEYLLGLREVHKSILQTRGGSSISVGDVVVMKDDSKRMFWRLALVEELLTGSDGHVRAATVRAVKSGRQGQMFRRSVKHLYPLEVSAEKNRSAPAEENRSKNAEKGVNETEGDRTETSSSRPRREAAVAGELRRRLVVK